VEGTNINKACYRKLHKYKYQLAEDYKINVGIFHINVEHDYFSLAPNGELLIKKYYAWDGPSGPTIDTETFMRGSLIHDCLYQMMRLRCLDIKYREATDDLLKKICLEDGMSRVRAWYVHKAVRWFAKKNAEPGTEEKDIIICLPR
jgi:hypothetical protein